MNDWYEKALQYVQERLGGGQNPDVPPAPPGPDPDTVTIEASEPNITTFDIGEPQVRPPSNRPGGFDGAEPFVGPVQPQGPEYRADVLNPEPFVGPVGPMNGPEYRPDLMKSAPSAPSVSIGELEGFQNKAQAQTVQPTAQPAAQPGQPPQAPAQAAMRRPEPAPTEQAPKDDTAMWAALRQIANAGGLNKRLGLEPDMGYYDTRIDLEKQKQKDWRERLATQLKQRFEQEQQGRLFEHQSKEGDARRGNQRDIADANRKSSEAMADMANKRSWGQFNISQKRLNEHYDRTEARLQDSTDANNAEQAVKAYPSNRSLEAASGVEQTLSAGRVPQGWGRLMTSLRAVSPNKWGDALTAISNAGLSPEEQKEAMDVWELLAEEARLTSGQQVTDSEFSRILIKTGLGPGQSNDTMAAGIGRAARNVRAAAKRAWQGQSPGVQGKLRARGLTPSDFGEPNPEEADSWEPVR